MGRIDLIIKIYKVHMRKIYKDMNDFKIFLQDFTMIIFIMINICYSWFFAVFLK